MVAFVLVATPHGLLVFADRGERTTELAGRKIDALSPEVGGGCLAVVDEKEIWRRDPRGEWRKVATSPLGLQSITSAEDSILGGAMDEAAIVRIATNGDVERLKGFDHVEGRGAWFAGGPPLGVRALTVAAGGAAILAAVHVGGIPRSSDRGETWKPTLPITYDVHEVRAHPSRPNVVAAATAVGLCASADGGQTWTVYSKGLDVKNSLAVAMLPREVLFGISDGPRATRSQLWRWRVGENGLERVSDGLPEWLEGKIDTAYIGANGERAALLDGGGNLWLSTAGSSSWKRIAADLPSAAGIAILDLF